MDSVTQQTAAAPENFFPAEKTTVRIITGSKWLFITLYMLLCFLFSLILILSILAFLTFAVLFFTGGIPASSIAVNLKAIAGLNFQTLFAASGESAQEAAAASLCLASAAAGGLLSVILGFLIKALKAASTRIISLGALLHGYKRGFIPAKEGIYKLLYINLMSGSRFYGLYPWAVLHMHFVNSKKQQIYLKLRYMLLCLETGKSGKMYFDRLSEFVYRHLPENQRTPKKKKDGFKWPLAIVLTAAVFVLGNFAGKGYETISDRGDGGQFCDIGGSIHGPEVTGAFHSLQRTYVYQIYDGNVLVHKYCLFHGCIFATLHPVLHARFLYRTAYGQGLNALIPDPMAFAFIIFLPAYLWLSAVILIVASSRPQVFRFREL